MINIEWAGDNPYFLVVHPKDEEATGIDLDFRGWSTINADLMRKPGNWYLFRKADEFPVLRLFVDAGEQPYYTAHTTGKLSMSSGGSRTLLSFGIGKKLRDGSVQRLWVLPNGTVCGGEDVDDIASQMISEMGPLPIPEDEPLVIEGEATPLD